MEFKEIDHLLNKYFEGESSIEEEAEIRTFFEANELRTEKYKRLKAMFRFYESGRNEKSELQIEDLIPNNKKKRKTLRFVYYAIAASVAILIGFLFMQDKTTETEKPVYAYINGKPVENEEVAYKEAQKALMMISTNLNEGTKNVDQLSEFDRAIKILTTN